MRVSVTPSASQRCFTACLPDFEAHHEFFQRRITGALADAVDRALDLAYACSDGGVSVGDRKTQVVVTMRAEHRAVGVPHTGAHGLEKIVDFVRRGVADG